MIIKSEKPTGTVILPASSTRYDSVDFLMIRFDKETVERLLKTMNMVKELAAKSFMFTHSSHFEELGTFHRWRNYFDIPHDTGPIHVYADKSTEQIFPQPLERLYLHLLEVYPTEFAVSAIGMNSSSHYWAEYITENILLELLEMYNQGTAK